MAESKFKKYIKNVFRFYFAPVWQSFLTILYLAFFAYFSVFYFGNVWLAIKFVFFTLAHSAKLLGLIYLLWGVVFIISLIIPLSASVYSIFLLYEIWRTGWEKKYKILVTILIVLAVLLLIVSMDEITRIAARQEVLKEFVAINKLNVSGR